MPSVNEYWVSSIVISIRHHQTIKHHYMSGAQSAAHSPLSRTQTQRSDPHQSGPTLPTPATETNPEWKCSIFMFQIEINSEMSYVPQSSRFSWYYGSALHWTPDVIKVSSHYLKRHVQRASTQHTGPQILMDRLYVFGGGGPRPRPAAATSRPAD